MLRFLVIPFFILFMAACSDSSPTPDDSSRKGYENADFGIGFELPEDWTAVENTRAPSGLVVSVFPLDRSQGINLPLDIHAPGDLPYVSFWPGGLGTEPPAGRSARWGSADTALPELNFAVDAERSIVFQLEDGTPWAYLIYPQERHAVWSDGGFLFAQYRTEGLEVSCRGVNGQPKPVSGCDPMGGDELSRTGTIGAASRQTVDAILSSLTLTEAVQEPIGELIRVEAPGPNQAVASPLRFSGEARGYYYFEADFPVRLERADGTVLATGLATAQSDWMTEDWVPFTGSLEFEAPDDERGYLVFERANPSGLEENARTYRVPVRFPTR